NLGGRPQRLVSLKVHPEFRRDRRGERFMSFRKQNSADRLVHLGKHTGGSVIRGSSDNGDLVVPQRPIVEVTGDTIFPIRPPIRRTSGIHERRRIGGTAEYLLVFEVRLYYVLPGCGEVVVLIDAEVRDNTGQRQGFVVVLNVHQNARAELFHV